MDGSCCVCHAPTGSLESVCQNQQCQRRAKPCRTCGIPKMGRSPYCPYCKMDRLNGVRLTSDHDWVARREGRDRRPKRRPKDGPPLDGLYWCSGCRDWLHPRWFLRFKEYAAGRDIPAQCRPCRSHASHSARVRQQFGIDALEYQRILDVQDGVCAICGGAPRTSRLAVDHDHGTGAIRGLLCSRCNNDLLGSAHDSIAILRRAIEYLEHPPAQEADLTSVVNF